ncbi:unnamed protein product [Angiostrongylus costaricensis]|uniref:Uncharacterized protein n=1 Tax=Angiostrongylus costaricensis TaxID=334426 RepID=A0A0R3PW08_ANGCS|nr:unnamed protein product [Angiostrongylus costaricensis]
MNEVRKLNCKNEHYKDFLSDENFSDFPQPQLIVEAFSIFLWRNGSFYNDRMSMKSKYESDSEKVLPIQINAALALLIETGGGFVTSLKPETQSEVESSASGFVVGNLSKLVGTNVVTQSRLAETLANLHASLNFVKSRFMFRKT